MRPEKLVVATANPDKLTEISFVLNGIVELEPRPVEMPEVIEDGLDLESNARLKAKAVCEFTKKPAISDDTGLEVDALGGAPGVHSARFAGEDATYLKNVEKILEELSGIPAHLRTARFVTVAMVYYPDGKEISSRGIVEGHILEVPLGAGGFGYDPVFVPVEGDGRTFAEMGDEKHNFSHRARAFRYLSYSLRNQ